MSPATYAPVLSMSVFRISRVGPTRKTKRSRQAAERAAERRRRDEEAAEAQRLWLAREAEVAAKAAAKAEAKAARARATPGAPPATSEAAAGAAKSPAPLTVRNLLAGRVQ